MHWTICSESSFGETNRSVDSEQSMLSCDPHPFSLSPLTSSSGAQSGAADLICHRINNELFLLNFGSTPMLPFDCSWKLNTIKGRVSNPTENYYFLHVCCMSIINWLRPTWISHGNKIPALMMKCTLNSTFHTQGCTWCKCESDRRRSTCWQWS